MLPEREKKLNKFLGLIEAIKARNNKPNSVKNRNFDKEKLINSIHKLNGLKLATFKKRYNEAKSLFNSKKDSIKVSCFELMEYNFHENSHTNVLQYLFDYRLSGKLGARILKSFLKHINTSSSKSISSLIDKYSYLTEREKSIGIGRMDLFIIDSQQKFVIMIENKLLADISEMGDRENDNENLEQITRTQLTNYKEYIIKNYNGYKTLFVLLSYKLQDLIDKDYVTLDYNFLLKVLTEFDNKDNILIEYKLLLENITKDHINNIFALELGNLLINTPKSASLTEIQNLKKYFV